MAKHHASRILWTTFGLALLAGSAHASSTDEAPPPLPAEPAPAPVVAEPAPMKVEDGRPTPPPAPAADSRTVDVAPGAPLLPQMPELITPAAADAAEELSGNTWELNAPRATLLNLDGYMRLRGNMHHNTDLKNENSPWVRTSANEDTFTSWDMRLRLEPVINVTEQLRIGSTVDVMDNLVFGSTPGYLPLGSDGEAMAMLEHGQASPPAGVNALSDSIAVRRLWLEADLMDDRVRIIAGRVPAHFGLGIWYNNGNCLDCDGGDAVDRLQVVVDLGDITLAPTYDILSSGLMRRPLDNRGGQVFDLDNVDDAMEVSIQVAHRNTPAEIEALLDRGQSVFNFGAIPIYRRQGREVRSSYLGVDYDPAPELAAGEDPYYRTDGRVYALDGWAAYYTPQLSLEAEAVLAHAEYKGEDGRKLTGLQYGLAFEGRWRPLPKRRDFTVHLHGGLASGDDSAGFGAYGDRDDQAPGDDDTVNNFVFNPSYQVDKLLFRHLVGTVTDAFYIKPGLTYLFNESVGGTAGVLYGQALNATSTPSYHIDGVQSAAAPLGVELNAEVFFRTGGVVGVEGFDYPWGRSPQRLSDEMRSHPVKGGLVGSISYGLLFPLGGWRNNNPGFAGTEEERDPTTMVHAVLARLAVVF